MANAGKNEITPLGEAIKIKAIKKRMTLTEVAESVGTTYRFLYQIMYGIKPGRKYVPKIAELLEIDISKFVA